MKYRQSCVVILILATMWHPAAAQPKSKKIQVELPPLERVLARTDYPQPNTALLDLIAVKPEMPLGPQDVLKSYEIAMSLVADKTSNDLAVIVQAQQANQITREQAEYSLQQRYQIAMMQYQVLSALHDVLKHDIDEVNQAARRTLREADFATVLVVPLPGSPPRNR